MDAICGCERFSVDGLVEPRYKRSQMMKTLFLSPPSFDGFDGGAGSRYQARREVTSYWYPTWLAQPAALVPGAKLIDCPPHNVGKDECLRVAKDYDHVIIHTSTPSLKNDCKVAEAIKAQKPDTTIGFVGAHATDRSVPGPFRVPQHAGGNDRQSRPV